MSGLCEKSVNLLAVFSILKYKYNKNNDIVGGI